MSTKKTHYQCKIRSKLQDFLCKKTVTVATHCLLEAVVALVTRTWGLKAILLEDGGDESASVCSKESE